MGLLISDTAWKDTSQRTEEPNQMRLPPPPPQPPVIITFLHPDLQIIGLHVIFQDQVVP